MRQNTKEKLKREPWLRAAQTHANRRPSCVLLWADTFGWGHRLCYHLFCPALILHWRRDNHNSDTRQQTCLFSVTEPHGIISQVHEVAVFLFKNTHSDVMGGRRKLSFSHKDKHFESNFVSVPSDLFSAHKWICYRVKKKKATLYHQITILKVNHSSDSLVLRKLVFKGKLNPNRSKLSL